MVWEGGAESCALHDSLPSDIVPETQLNEWTNKQCEQFFLPNWPTGTESRHRTMKSTAGVSLWEKVFSGCSTSRDDVITLFGHWQNWFWKMLIAIPQIPEWRLQIASLGQKPKHSSFTAINDKEKKLTFALTEQEPANFACFCLKKDNRKWINYQLIESLTNRCCSFIYNYCLFPEGIKCFF